jgi:hypothetical protein
MPPVKTNVGPFELVDSESGYYKWENRQELGDGTSFVYTLSIDKYDDMWNLHAGLYGEGFGRRRTPEQIQSVEQYGSPSGYAKRFKLAKRMAYSFMTNFSGSPDYNGLLDLASKARWVNRHSGPYYE